MDGTQRRNVIVLGNELLKTLFPGRPAVGAFILLNGIRFEVVGTMPHLGRGDNMWLNMRGYIPFQVMAEALSAEGRESSEVDFVHRVSARSDRRPRAGAERSAPDHWPESRI